MKALLFLTGMIVLLVTGCGFTSTSPGEAVVFSRFGAVDPTCYPAGFYFYIPLTTSVYHVDVKVQKFEVTADASSRDLQNVHTTIVVNFSIDASKCHGRHPQPGNNADRNESMIPNSGLSIRIQSCLASTPIVLNGKTTALTHMPICVMNGMRKRRSRYVTVAADSENAIPSDNSTVSSISTGNSTICGEGV